MAHMSRIIDQAYQVRIYIHLGKGRYTQEKHTSALYKQANSDFLQITYAISFPAIPVVMTIPAKTFLLASWLVKLSVSSPNFASTNLATRSANSWGTSWSTSLSTGFVPGQQDIISINSPNFASSNLATRSANSWETSWSTSLYWLHTW